jgi:hypothetical protein
VERRRTILWTLVVFFGASLMFASIRQALDGESDGLVLGVQLAAGLLLVGGIVLFLRRRR